MYWDNLDNFLDIYIIFIMRKKDCNKKEKTTKKKEYNYQPPIMQKISLPSPNNKEDRVKLLSISCWSGCGGCGC